MAAPSNEKALLTQNIGAVQSTYFLPADTTVPKTIFTASANGSIIYGINISTNETASANDLFIYNLAETQNFAHIDIPANSGTDGIANAIAGMNQTNMPFIQKDANGNPFLKLRAGATLAGSMRVSVATNKTCLVTIISEEL